MIKPKRWPPWTNAPIVLYHGTLADRASAIVQHGIRIALGNPNVDFGRGFYTTTLLSQAWEWAEKVGKRRSEPFAVVSITIDRQLLGSLHTLAFVRPSEDYWSFVAQCRRKSWIAGNRVYDVIYGPVARSWFQPAHSQVFPGSDQISFHTPTAESFLNQQCQVEIKRWQPLETKPK